MSFACDIVLTFSYTFSIIPFSSIIYVTLDIPIYSRPMNFFLPHTLYAPSISWLSSQSRGNWKFCLSQNFFCFCWGSAEQPIICIFFSSNFWNSSRNPCPSIFQPGVLAFGKNQRITFFPEKSINDTGLFSASGNAKSGALFPIFNNFTSWFRLTNSND